VSGQDTVHYQASNVIRKSQYILISNQFVHWFIHSICPSFKQWKNHVLGTDVNSTNEDVLLIMQ